MSSNLLNPLAAPELLFNQKEDIVLAVRGFFYPDQSLEDVKLKIQFTSTQISFNDELNVTTVHPVLWTPQSIMSPYVVIEAPGDTNTWGEFVVSLRSQRFTFTAGLAFKFFYGKQEPEIVPPAYITYRGELGSLEDYNLLKAICTHRQRELLALKDVLVEGNFINHTLWMLDKALDKLEKGNKEGLYEREWEPAW
ncbi:hypothetical protein NUW58_g1483 [Xylaria curta]|uniref:Uncharacterized protein n=1 Tax=Xylaria curta TaxID=42375 RepID=A0ACC1PLU1_9PEZI|nr:hypothetical protein NUW58_g1483 [Xylaria curta]